MGTCLLVDNGSLRPASTVALRAMADALSTRIGQEALPVSLLHSAKIPADQLGGKPAEILEPFLRSRLEAGESEFSIVPLFFGPSRALTDFLPKRAAALRRRFPCLRLRCAPVLCDDGGALEKRVPEILRDHVLETMHAEGIPSPVVVLDHGSPAPEVTRVRNLVAGRLRLLLRGRIPRLAAASMQRREGTEFRFNEPLLERILRREGFNRGRVVIAMMFLSPGRHAGPDGDVAAICREAESANPLLETAMTRLAGEHPLLVDILADRFHGLSKGKHLFSC